MAKSTIIPVLLVRAGPTSWDTAGRLGGACDLPVCPAATMHTQEVCRELDSVPVVAVITGPDEASRSTAKMIAEACGARVRSFEGLHEVDVGLWEGLLPTELEEKFPTAFRQWQEDPGSIVIPGGESVVEAQERIIGAMTRALERLADNGKLVVVVLKPIAMGLVLCWLNGVSLDRLWRTMGEAGATERREVPRSLLEERREGSQVSA